MIVKQLVCVRGGGGLWQLSCWKRVRWSQLC